VRATARLLASVLALGPVLAGCAARGPARDPGDTGGPAAAEVRAERARSNAAIARHDAAGAVADMLPDVHVTGGNGGHLAGRDAVLAAFTRQFADSAFVVYVRTTEGVDVSATAPLAAERGRWVGRWRRDDGVQELGGRYLAMWRRDTTAGAAHGWRLQSELYVTLGCTGSARCGR
jgi:ketosteroid isomerase-like protein